MSPSFDWDGGLDFRKQKKDLGKKYRNIEKDVQKALAEIERDHTIACQATALPGYAGTVWKYRIGNSDTKQGRSGGYRLLIHFNESTGRRTPLAIYSHEQYPGQPSVGEIDQWIKGVLTRSATS